MKTKPQITMDVKEFIRKQYGWSGRSLINLSDLTQMFKRANYNPTWELVDFVSKFYNLHILFPNCDVSFDVKQVLVDYPYKYFYDQFCETAGTQGCVPFAEIKNGHMVLVCDERNHLYGIFDEVIVDFGKNYDVLLKRLYTM